MRILQLTFIALLLALTATPTATGADLDVEAAKAQVLGNLQLKYPQLAQIEVTISELTPSPYEGLDQGTFTLQGQRGPQTQRFFVSRDLTTLFIIADEVDVSKTPAEIEAAIAERAAAEAERMAQVRTRLEESTVGLPARGNPDAPVTIVSFTDFQCPYCSRGAATMDEVLRRYPEDVSLVIKHFPLGFHAWARPAAIAALCAGEQNDDAFWALHDAFFANQKRFTAENVVATSQEYLADSDVDMERWARCAGDPTDEAHIAAAQQVDADMAMAQSLGVTGTPAFFVNGEFVNGAQPITAFEPLIEAAIGTVDQ
jgi:protein-disulfide isomerase